MDDFSLYGYSVFETLRAKKGLYWRWASHWKRLQTSAKAIDLRAPDKENFLEILYQAHEIDSDQVLRIALLKQGGRWSESPVDTRTEIWSRPYADPPDSLVLMPVPDLMPIADQTRQYKTGSRLFYELWAGRARAMRAHDALFFDLDKNILETATGNIFLAINGRWLTPPSSLGVLPGIARAWVLESGLAKEDILHRQDLERAEAVFVTNAVHGLLPVRAIGDHDYSVEAPQSFQASLGEREFSPLPRLP